MSFLAGILLLLAFGSAFLYTVKLSIGLAVTVVLSACAICVAVYGAAEVVEKAVRGIARPGDDNIHWAEKTPKSGGKSQ